MKDERTSGEMEKHMSPITYEDVLSYWKSKNVKNGTDLDAIVNGMAILLAYHTTKIEEPGVTFDDTREIFENGRVIGYTGDVKELFALRNAKRGWENLLDAFDEGRQIDEELIKAFHFSLTEGTYDKRRYDKGERPGEYKKGEYVTGKYETGALSEDVSEEIGELLEDIGDVDDKNALISAAFFHAKFENIHPFADGNGRVGRLLMNYYLVMHDHPVVIVYVEDRKEYMSALEAWDRDQNLDPLVLFLKGQTVKTWESILSKYVG